MLSDSAPRVLLTQGRLRERLPTHGVEVIALDEQWAEIARQPSGNLDTAALGLSSHHLAYVIYTSGSTGQPKGAMNEHRGVMNRLQWMQDEYRLGPQDRVLQKTPFSFDVSVWEFFWTLMSGARLIVARPEGHREPEYLCQLIEKMQVTTLHFVPSMLQVFLEHPRAGAAGSLRHIVCSGEELSASLQKKCFECLPQIQLSNLYGPTEAAIDVTAWECSPEDQSTRVPIGRPISNIRMYVLDRHGEPVPAGVSGEIYIGGVGVARGYLKRPELTSERFVKNSFSADPQARLYKTGDLGRWRTDGAIEYLGRNDQQVKIRGFRIELGEIEVQLARYASIREAVVLVREDVAGEKRLVAYVVPRDGESGEALLSAEALRAYLKPMLPEYMVPSAFVLLERLPLTPNGKVDRKGLPAPPAIGPGREYVAPRTATEQALCEVWQQVLGRERVGIEENFFSIGGDSILSIRVVASANRAGVAITTRQVFTHQTIAELAQAVGAGVIQERPQQAIEGTLSLLPIQRSFLQEDSEHVHHYNQAVLLQAPPQLTPGQLQEIVRSLYERHDALRLRFARNEAGQWHALHQSLSESMVQQSCTVEALAGEPASWEAIIQERCEVYQRSLDIHHGPLFRVVYLQGTGGARLLVVAHHLAVDGFSWRILLNDLQYGYAQQQRGEPIRLSAKSSSYQQWGEALERYARSDAVQKQRAHWLSVWQDSSGKPRRSHPSRARHASTQRVSVSLDAQETSALLKESAARTRMQVNELLLSGVYLGLRRWSGDSVQRFALEGHGREDLFEWLDISETVGWFTTMYPLRLHSTTEDVADVLTAVREQYRGVPHHGIGYGLLRDVLEDAALRAAEVPRGIDLVFNYLGQFDAAAQQLGEFAQARESNGTSVDPQRRRGHHLTLNGMVNNGELWFHLEYGEQDHEQESIRRLGAQIERALRDVIAYCTDTSIEGLWAEPFTPETDHGADLAELLYPVQEQLSTSSSIELGAI
jgi:amino acid adenylation domain-containing protein/non-ribosomal peptide synthase protein (TIGR01720 family)